MTIEEIMMLVINFEMAIDNCFYARESGDKAEYDKAVNEKRTRFNDVIQAIKQYKEQK